MNGCSSNGDWMAPLTRNRIFANSPAAWTLVRVAAETPP